MGSVMNVPNQNRKVKQPIEPFRNAENQCFACYIIKFITKWSIIEYRIPARPCAGFQSGSIFHLFRPGNRSRQAVRPA